MKPQTNQIRAIEDLPMPQQQTVPLQAWFIWFCAAGFYLYEMILRVSPGVMTHQLMESFSINATAVGVLTGAYHHTYSALQIPCGVIVDRFGLRRVVTISCLLCVAGAFMFATSHSFAYAYVGQVMIGAGSACAFLSTLKVGADWFTPNRFALLSGLTNMMGTCGSTFGGQPFASLVNKYGWRNALSISALAGIAMALFCWLIIRDKPLSSTEQKKRAAMPLLQGVLYLGKNPQMWLIGLVGGLTYVPVATFAGLWSVPYLMHTYGIDNETAAIANTMIFLGVAIGSPLSVLFSDFLKRRVLTIQITTILTGIVFSAIIFIHKIPFQTMMGLLFMAGFFTGGQVLCFACAKENSSPEFSGTTAGFTNALVMISSAAILQPVLGMLLDFAWDGQMVNGLRYYSDSAFQFALSAIPVCSILSLIVMQFIRETYQKGGSVH